MHHELGLYPEDLGKGKGCYPVYKFFFLCSSGSIPKQVRREKCKKWDAALKFCSETLEHGVARLLKVYFKKKKRKKVFKKQ